jgi:hypothetical protein
MAFFSRLNSEASTESRCWGMALKTTAVARQWFSSNHVITPIDMTVWNVECSRHSRTNTTVSRRRQQKREPSAWGYNWVTLFLGAINIGTWCSRLGESQIWDSKIWSEPHKIRTQEWLHWQGPAATINGRPICLSDRVPTSTNLQLSDSNKIWL